MKKHARNIIGSGQRGAALVVSLILLLVMTLVGVAAMNRARLEISMSALMQQEEVALRRAERGLLLAETYIEQLASTPAPHGFSGTGEYTHSADIGAREGHWGSLGKPIVSGGNDTGDAYIVQYLGSMVVPGETQAETTGAPIPGAEIFVTRTFIRASSDGKSSRIVESLYSTKVAP